ncbi:MAG: S-methyl-5-thioribose kinase, partial [Caldilineaceae bacterium]|nr:S-methyl-5-thioribose kinase [Caldilineaceae bacterium]
NNRGELAPPAYWDYPGGDVDFARFRAGYIQNILRDVAGYGGCKMLRRMMGIVSVWDISSIEDPAQRAVAERLAIRIGSRWVQERHQVNSIDDLIAIVREETA